MGEREENEYAIKYQVIEFSDGEYILFPISLEIGIREEEGFETEEEIIPYIETKNDLQNEYVVDMIYTEEELQYVYEYQKEDEEDFLGEYFFEDYEDTLIYIDSRQENQESLVKNEINLRVIKDQNNELTFYMDKSIPSVLLNEKALQDLLESKDLNQLKLTLKKYQRKVQQFDLYNSKKGITKICMENGKVTAVETERKFAPNTKFNIANERRTLLSNDISYQGLRKYLKERIYGHEEELDIFAQKLYMNYTANDNEVVDSILLVGPTGTGKTETVRAACEYMNIPYMEVNATNIVPEGIVGMSMEDVIISLYEKAGKKIKKAERGLIFLDEFDKLNTSDLDIKVSVKDILLTFTSGGTFPIRTDHYNFLFNSAMTNKVFAGVFEKIAEKPKLLGFKTTEEDRITLGTGEEIRKKIIEKKYFTLEELTRISTILGYDELTRETKKQILLYSKLSEFSKKKERYKRQFGIDMVIEDSYIDAILDSLEESETGMRSINNIIRKNLNKVEQAILEEDNKNYKRLVLTKDSVTDNQFDLS